MNSNHEAPDSAELSEAMLTAYALGELSEGEQAEVEARLADSQDARRFVEETRSLAEHFRRATLQRGSSRPAVTLCEVLQRRLDELEDTKESSAASASPPQRPRRGRRRWMMAAAAACALIVGVPLSIIAVINATRGNSAPAMTSPAILERENVSRELPRRLKGLVNSGERDTHEGPGGGPAIAVGSSDANRIDTVGKGGSLQGATATNGDVTAHNGWGPFLADDRQGSVLNWDPVAMSGAGGTWGVDSDITVCDPYGQRSDFWVDRDDHGIYSGSINGGLLNVGDSTDVLQHHYWMSISGTPPITAGKGGPHGVRNNAISSDLSGGDMAITASKAGPYGVGNNAISSDLSGVNIDLHHSPGPNWLGGNVCRNGGTLAGKAGPHGGGYNGVTNNITGGGTLNFDPYNRPEANWGAGNGCVSGGTLTVQSGATIDISPGYSQGGRYVSWSENYVDWGAIVEPRGKGGCLDSVTINNDIDFHGTDRKVYAYASNEDPDFYSRLGLDGSRLGRPPGPLPDDAPGSEQYAPIAENPFLPACRRPLSTFSIDVDTASYANLRRFLNQGRLPPRAAVRIEEMINYFSYDYPQPEGDAPFSVNMEVAQCPWQGDHRLLRIGLKGREIDREKRGPANLVFLLDVSGSMGDDDKLPLLKQAMNMLVGQLGEDDRVAIVTYAGTAGVQLQSTRGHQRQQIISVIEALEASGSTNGGAGIQLAYQQGTKNFVKGGINRVILATDGDLNVGITRDDDLVRLIQEQATSGVFLTVLGFGTGNLKDAKLEALADRGNGAYAYVDNLREARKVLVEQLSGSLVTIAKDVKIQIEFNPAEVHAYRLIGYENRALAARDFNDDKKDAGEIGAGHTVTALYEIVPTGARQTAAGGRRLKYQRVVAPPRALSDEARSGELLTLSLRYKQPEAEQSRLLEFVVKDSGKRFGEASPDFQFASAVAAFGMVLRGSPHRGDATAAAVAEYAASAIGDDPHGYRAEFLDLVRRARQISSQ